MDRSIYLHADSQETEHLWSRACHDLIRTTIDYLAPRPEKEQIFEASYGTVGNLDMPLKSGRVDAFEFDGYARATSQSKPGLLAKFGALTSKLKKRKHAQC